MYESWVASYRNEEDIHEHGTEIQREAEGDHSSAAALSRPSADQGGGVAPDKGKGNRQRQPKAKGKAKPAPKVKTDEQLARAVSRRETACVTSIFSVTYV